MMNENYLVAGGNSGIGLETVKGLTREGASVLAAGRNFDNIMGISRVTSVDFDATDPDAAPDLPDELDGLVYCPGTITLKPFKSLTDADFRRELEVNFFGAVRLIRAALPALRKGTNASIVLFSTVAVQTGMPYHASIASAKAAVEGLTRSLAAEFSPDIRVNCIAPSLTDTPLASGLLNSEAKADAARGRHPLKTVGNPTDISELVLFLLGEKSRFMTGQILAIDGGMSSVRTF